MARISVFNFLTLNGFYKGLNEDISWHKHSDQDSEFAENSLKSENILLFGRTTYEIMASYWPSPMALENDPIIARGMNNSEKIVFSNSLKSVGWNNTRVVSGDIITATKKLKKETEKDMTILGSGTIVTQFAEYGLIDSFLFMIDPVAIGRGTPIFSNISRNLDLKLKDTKIFTSGVVLLSYEPA